MTTGSSKRSTRRRHGNIAIITAICLVMLFGFAALAVDVGNMYRVRMETRAALDAAALAGASGLNGQSSGLGVAMSRAITYAANHNVYGAALSLSPGNITIGRWDPVAHRVVAASVDESNAVHVQYDTPAVTHPFAAILGNAASPVGADAVALGGGPMATRCGFPLVVADCILRQATLGDSCNYCLTYQDNGSDTAGFTAFSGAVSASSVCDAAAAACTGGTGCGGGRNNAVVPAINSDGTCAANCANAVSLVDNNAELRVNNGNFLSQSPGGMCRLIQAILTRNGVGSPEPFVVTVPVLRTPAGGACNPSFVNMQPVAGFARMTILGAKCGASDPGVMAPNTTGISCTPPPSEKYLMAVLNCNSVIDAPGGTPDFGLQARPRLVW